MKKIINMKRWWNDSNRDRPNYWEKKRIKHILVRHKLHMPSLGGDPGHHDDRLVTNCLSQDMDYFCTSYPVQKY
jgi:hypothetical protein